MTDTAQMVCHDCKNTFKQPFVCITCGAQKLYDATLQRAQERAEKAEAENAALRELITDISTQIHSMGTSVTVASFGNVLLNRIDAVRKA